MTYKEEILSNLFPEYENTKATLDTYSEYELGLVVDMISEEVDIDYLNDYIVENVQFDIIEFLVDKIIENGDSLYAKEEITIMDFTHNYNFLDYDITNKAYKLSKQSLILLFENLIENVEDNYVIKEDVDFKDIVYTLNTTTPLKFILDD